LLGHAALITRRCGRWRAQAAGARGLLDGPGHDMVAEFLFFFILFSFSISGFFHNFFKIAPNELKPISKFF
jgi:hypothetical protein